MHADVTNKKRNPYTRMACQYCKDKHQKCDGKRPCSNCAGKNIDCVYRQERNKKRDHTDMPLGEEVVYLRSKLEQWKERYSELLAWVESQGLQPRAHFLQDLSPPSSPRYSAGDENQYGGGSPFTPFSTATNNPKLLSSSLSSVGNNTLPVFPFSTQRHTNSHEQTMPQAPQPLSFQDMQYNNLNSLQSFQASLSSPSQSSHHLPSPHELLAPIPMPYDDGQLVNPNSGFNHQDKSLYNKNMPLIGADFRVHSNNPDLRAQSADTTPQMSGYGNKRKHSGDHSDNINGTSDQSVSKRLRENSDFAEDGLRPFSSDHSRAFVKPVLPDVDTNGESRSRKNNTGVTSRTNLNPKPVIVNNNNSVGMNTMIGFNDMSMPAISGIGIGPMGGIGGMGAISGISNIGALGIGVPGIGMNPGMGFGMLGNGMGLGFSPGVMGVGYGLTGDGLVGNIDNLIMMNNMQASNNTTPSETSGQPPGHTQGPSIVTRSAKKRSMKSQSEGKPDEPRLQHEPLIEYAKPISHINEAPQPPYNIPPSNQ